MIAAADEKALDAQAREFAAARGVDLESGEACPALPTGHGTLVENLERAVSGREKAGMIAVFRSHLEALSDARAIRIESDSRERERLTFWIDLLTAHFEQGESLVSIARRYGHKSHTWTLDQIAEIRAAGLRWLRSQGVVAVACAFERCKRGESGARAIVARMAALGRPPKFCCDLCASADRQQRKRDRDEFRYGGARQ